MGRDPRWDYRQMIHVADKASAKFMKDKELDLVGCIDEIITLYNGRNIVKSIEAKKAKKLFDELKEMMSADQKDWLINAMRQQRYESDRVRISVSSYVAEELDEMIYLFDDAINKAEVIVELINFYKRKNKI